MADPGDFAARSRRGRGRRGQADPALTQGDERFRLLVESVGEYAIFSLDVQGRITSWNKGAQRIAGYSEEEIRGEHCSRFYLPEDVRRGLPAEELRAAQSAGEYTSEGYRVRKDGSRYRACVTLTRLTDAAGKVLGFAGVARDVSGRDGAQEGEPRPRESARAGEDQFRLLADSISQLSWMANADGSIDWYNRRWYEYTGTTPAQMEGWGWQSVHDPAVLPQVLERWRHSLASGQPFEMEFPLRGADGRFRWFLTRVSPLRDAQGRVVRWFGTNTDVEELRRAREAVAGGEERLRLALAAARMGTYDWTAAGGKVAWSEQTARLHGIELQDFRGTMEHVRELMHPQDQLRVLRAMEEASAQGKDFEVEYRVVHPRDGSVHWLFACGRTLRDESGAPSRTIGALFDVTEQKQAQDALRASAGIWQTLNEVGKVIAAELDMEKLIQFVTDAATKLSRAHFGAFFYNLVSEKGESYTLYAISGAPRDAFARFPLPRNTEVFKPTFSGTAVVRSDDITKDPRYGKSAPYHGMPKGHLPVVSYLAVPVTSRSGEVLGGLFFGHPEAGVFKEREEQLVRGLAAQAAVAIDNARLFQRAKDAVQLRDDFLSIASHELKTPLTPLKLQVQNLRRLVERGALPELPPERLRNIAATCDRQIGRLTSLIEDLLDVARINAGRFRLNRRSVNLVQLVQETLRRYEDTFAAAGCTVALHAPPQLEGSWDEIRIEQAFINLLTNAAKYGPGKPIEIVLRQEADEALLSVADHGIGIAEADKERIFNRFERVGADASVTGLGLGLFITRQIVEAHGGTVRVQSAPGQGATFTLALPVEMRDPQPPAGGR